MAQGLNAETNRLSTLLTAPITHQNFIDREIDNERAPSPQPNPNHAQQPPSPQPDPNHAQQPPSPQPDPNHAQQASPEPHASKNDPDWKSDSESDLTDTETESDSESSSDVASDSDDEGTASSGDVVDSGLVNGHSHDSKSAQIVPPEEEVTSSQDVCSALLDDLVNDVVRASQDSTSTTSVKIELCSSESSCSQSLKLEQCPESSCDNSLKNEEVSLDENALESAPDLLDLIDCIDPESSQDIKSEPSVDKHMDNSSTANDQAPQLDENQGKKKKKRKRKRDENEEDKSRKRKRKDGEGKKRKREPGEKRRKKSKEDGNDGDGKKADKNDRKNIRKIIKEDDLDEETRTAQQQEMERKKRLQELQRNAQNNVHLKALLQSSDEEEDKSEGDIKSWRLSANKPVPKNKDVITLSSSDDDDVVMIDDDKKKKKKTTEAESDSDDDPNDAGCHVNDMLNIPDDEGRVLVNVGHPKEDPDIFINDRVAMALKPHQVGGIRFLYDNLIESLDHFKASNGFGCILAHSMGLGKTIQVVSFIDIFLRHTDAKYVLCIVPINTIQNWLNEFNMWLPVDPSKLPQPPPPKLTKQEKQEKQKQEKESNENFDPFGLNFMNYSWMNSGFMNSQQRMSSQMGSSQPMNSVSDPTMGNQPMMGNQGMNQSSQPMNQSVGNWNNFDYGNGQWNMGRSSMGQMGMSQNPYMAQTYGQQYPAVKQEFGHYGDYQQGYGGQCATGYSGQTMYQDPYNINYGVGSMNQWPPYQQFKQEPGFSQNGPPAEIPKFPPLTPPPEVNSSQIPPSSCSVSASQTTNPSVDLPPPLPSNDADSAAKSSSNVPYSSSSDGLGSIVKTEPSSDDKPRLLTNDIKTEPSDTVEVKSEKGVKTENKEDVKKEKGEREGAIDPELKDSPWRPFEVYVLSDNHKTMTARSKIVGEWKKTGGVMLMGYEMYRLLATRKPRKRPPRKTDTKKVIDVDQEDLDNELAIDIQAALLKPGPDLVICDEGHRIKNSHAGISQALKNIKTRRRVVLTGYPLQNNLVEYWCMVDFVRPNFLGTKSEFSNMFERPIMNGQCHDSTAADVKLMRYRAHVLHSLLEGFVQRRGHTVLRAALPPKSEYVVLVKMSDIQRKLYTTFMNRVNDADVAEWATTNPIKAFSVMCKIWNHPDILCKIVKRIKQGNVEDDLDLGDEGKAEEEGGAKKRPRKARGGKKKTSTPTGEEEGAGCEDKEVETKGNLGNTITYDWAQDLLSDYVTGDLNNGGKMLCMFTIMEESIAIGDKILIFSQSLFTLNLIEEFLSQAYVPIPGCEEKWTKNRHYYRLDGSTSATDREKMINSFNNPDNQLSWLFLLSTRAGCLGINLTGANRVIVYDASWNPCHDCQAVCRVYRYGQTKPCFIYRLVSDNTMEKRIYDRQVSKQTISDRVVDELNPQNNISRKQMEDLLHYEDMDQETLKVTDEMVEKFDDPVIQSLMRNNGDFITKEPFTHESLLIDRKDYRLSKAEKNMARLSYEREKKMSAYGGYTRPSYANYYPKSAANSLVTGIPGQSLVINRSLPTPLTRTAPSGGGTSKPVDGKTGGSTGVTVHQIVTTTDIVVPGSGKDPKSQYKIPAGQQVLVIKTPRGVYIRTPEGKIFAVRTAGKLGNETGLAGLGGSVSGGTGGGATGTPLLSSAAMTQKSLLMKKGPEAARSMSGATPRILGSVRRRGVATPSMRMANQVRPPIPPIGRPAAPSQSIINLDDSDSDQNNDEKTEAAGATTADEFTTTAKTPPGAPPGERKPSQVSLIKPSSFTEPPKMVKVVMKPSVSRQNSGGSDGSRSPRGEMTSILRKSPMGSPASARSPAATTSETNDNDKSERTITLVRPPPAKKPARTQIFLARSSEENPEKKNESADTKDKEAKLTLVTKPSSLTSSTTPVCTSTQGNMSSKTSRSVDIRTEDSASTASVSGSDGTTNVVTSQIDANSSVRRSSTDYGMDSALDTASKTPFQSMTTAPIAAPPRTNADHQTSYPFNSQADPSRQRAFNPQASSVPAFSQPYKSAGRQMTSSTSQNAAPSGGSMTESEPKSMPSSKPMNWMLDDKPSSSLSTSNTSQQMAPSSFNIPQSKYSDGKNPLGSMMSMAGFSNSWTNPYSSSLPASQPLPPWPSMDQNQLFSDKKGRDSFTGGYQPPQPSQSDYSRYPSDYPSMGYFNNPYYQQQQQQQMSASFQNYNPNYPRSFGSSYYQQGQMYGQDRGGFSQQRYGQSLPNLHNSLESLSASFESGSAGGDSGSLKWQTAFTHAHPNSANSDLPDLSSLGEF